MSLPHPEPERPQLDPERMQIARTYGRERRRLLPLEIALSAGAFLLWWDVISNPLIAWLESQTTGFDVQVIVYVGLFAALMFVVNLPLDVYRHARSVHYGLSVQSWRSWVVDLLKGLLIGAIIGLPMLLILYHFLAAFPQTWWLWMGLVYLLLTILMTQLAPVLIMPLFLKFTPYEDDTLTPRLRALAEAAGTQVKGVFRTDLSSKTTAANAWLSGLGRTRRIVLGDTLLDEYRADEIVAVFAHEMGHQVHRDLGLGILVSSLVNVVGFLLAGLVMNWTVAEFGYSGPADLRAFPWLVLTLTGFGILTSPLLNGWSRSREWMADRYAYDHGPGSSAFADAMIRLSNQNLADPEPPAWMVWYSYSHPPVTERIRAAQAAGSP
ncbi:MAG: M48 family metallopeptidase [Caldilineales bacterium]|nr:M48 family metallopeptidase [Caldilineales bacterium]